MVAARVKATGLQPNFAGDSHNDCSLDTSLGTVGIGNCVCDVVHALLVGVDSAIQQANAGVRQRS